LPLESVRRTTYNADGDSRCFKYSARCARCARDHPAYEIIQREVVRFVTYPDSQTDGESTDIQTTDIVGNAASVDAVDERATTAPLDAHGALEPGDARKATDSTDQRDRVDRIDQVSPDASGERLRRRPGRPTAAMPVGQAETATLILRQARQLFMRRGFADVSVDEVAKAVGVTKPTLYYHFGDKAGMYTAVLVDLLREVGGYVCGIAAKELPLRGRLVDVASGYFVHANGTMEPMLRDAAQLIGPKHAPAIWAAYEEDFLRPLIALMQEGMDVQEIRSTDPRSLARAFIGLLDAFTAPGGRAARTPDEHRQVAEQVASLFLDGAMPRA
jgi:AcrR family transcriptional regulator